MLCQAAVHERFCEREAFQRSQQASIAAGL